jgi:hypothetical protein
MGRVINLLLRTKLNEGKDSLTASVFYCAGIPLKAHAFNSTIH